MAKFRKKPIVIEATQWWKNGDHPGDGPDDREGKVVRFYRDPEVPGQTRCRNCPEVMHVHGWIDTLEGEHVVCPGDWIITGVKGEVCPCKPDIFEATHEPVAPDDSEPVKPGLFEVQCEVIARQLNDIRKDVCVGDKLVPWEQLSQVNRDMMMRQARLVLGLMFDHGNRMMNEKLEQGAAFADGWPMKGHGHHALAQQIRALKVPVPS